MSFRINRLIEQLSDYGNHDACVRELISIGEPALPQLTLALIQSTDEQSIYGIFRILNGIGGPAVQALVQVLIHGSNAVRVAALQALASLGTEARGATPHLIKAMNDPDDEVRLMASYALLSAGQRAEQLLPTLQALLTTREDGYIFVVYEMITMMHKEGDDISAMIPLVLEQLHHPLPFVRGGAMSLLGDLSVVDAVPQLVPFLYDSTLEAFALDALETLDTPAARQAIERFHEITGR